MALLQQKKTLRETLMLYFQRTVISLLAGLLCASILFVSKSKLRQANILAAPTTERPPLYLPEAKYVKLITLGFDVFVSDILWFTTINYFGRQFVEKKDYRWLGHMCNLVTDLDEKASHAYEFCSSMLSWEAKEPEKAIEILSKAIHANPTVWRYRYLRGFVYWYFLERRDLALKDMIEASRKKNAPPFLATMASRLMVDQGAPDTAILFLKDLINNTVDSRSKEALEDKLKRAFISRDKKVLGEIAAKYQAKYKRKVSSLDELVAVGMLRFIPSDPFGGTYFIDAQTQQIHATSKEKGLVFHGKTAKTGIFKHKFRE